MDVEDKHKGVCYSHPFINHFSIIRIHILNLDCKDIHDILIQFFLREEVNGK